MKCENLQFNLSLYSDNILTDEEREILDAHLIQCPLCRQKLSDIQEIRNSLRNMARPEIPLSVLTSIRNAVATEISVPVPIFQIETKVSFREWLSARFMPYAVGSFASLLLGFALLWSLMTSGSQVQNEFAQSQPYPNSTVLLASSGAKKDSIDDITASQYAQTRLAFAGESPSLNPQGALVALTNSLVRGEMRDDEVVVVADVFGNGLAQIAEVVEPSKDREAVRELEKALKTDSQFAPFVPANLDQRSETVRVVLKIQSVDVNTHLQSTKH